MSSDNQSYLRFSVEESVWFQKGQEVSALLSISLDPNIVIQEDNQYVSIRGALELTGEYRIDEETTHEDTRDFTSVRVINEVNTREDGISELKHSFPVDITIPKNRIQNMDDVYVAIDSFDYELPRKGCLQLVADLSISGIYGSQQSVPMVESLVEDNEVEEQEFSIPRNEEKLESEQNLTNNDHSDVREESVEVESIKVELEELLETEQIEVEPVIRDEVEVQVEPEQTDPVATDIGEQEEPEREPIAAVTSENEESDTREPELLLRNAQEEEEVEVQSVNTGLYDSSSRASKMEEDEDDLFSPFEVEARKEVYFENEDEDKADESPILELVPEQQLEQKEEQEPVQDMNEEPVLEVAREEEPKLELVKDREPEEEPVKQPKVQVELKGRPEEKYNFGDSISKSVTAVEEREESKKEYTGKKGKASANADLETESRDENTLYLTKIFARDDEEDFTRMKICIAQQGDTLEKISERYEVSIQSLVRVNQLSDDYGVNDGQLLYIPKGR